MRRTKIVCTIGPSCNTKKVLEQMLRNGMNVARLNFSHGTHETHKKDIETFRRVRDRLGMPAAIMLDTRGPEIRLRDFKEGSASLKCGEEYLLTTEEILGDDRCGSINCESLPRQLSPGNTILIDDGRVSLKVIDADEKTVRCKVECGGVISNRKGINIPNLYLDLPYLSEQDKKDIRFGIEQDVDFIAASFVRRKEDVITLRRFLDYYGGHSIKIISKIENLEGVENFDAILKHSDGIMVARGDMGVEVDYDRLPGIQKRFIRRCYQSGKMVITATQMLESMIKNPTPTRAEITDVANAVFDGTSAVMLSGETAVGKNPTLAVKVMAKIAERAEHDAFEMGAYKGFNHDMDSTDITNAICDATCTTARDIKAKAIVVVTKGGQTARRMSKFRPNEPIVAATPVTKTYHQLSLSWGVYPVMARYQSTTDELFLHSVDCAKQLDLVADGDRVVITAGVPLGISGSTNIIKVQVVGEQI
ncbi:MAG: pyruvate kinase [Clostridiales bacterium]|nr:pyruvate kinase [Clostridiales bacterium]